MTISQNRLSCIFDAMNRTRIAVLGDLMLDIYISGPANRLSQELRSLFCKSASRKHGWAALQT